MGNKRGANVFRPVYGDRGWTLWPEHEDLSAELSNLLAASQEGGATVSECLYAVSRIDPTDPASWFRSWKALADTNRARGDAAHRSNHLPTARSNWLRAVSYYRAAAVVFDEDCSEKCAALTLMRRCAHDYVAHLAPPGAVVEIPWLEDLPLEGYFLPAQRFGRAPAVLCIGEPDHRKEEFLCKVQRYARDRGLAVLAVDVLGPGSGIPLHGIVGWRDLHSAVGRCLDYLRSLSCIDPDRLAVFADSPKSSFVARGLLADSSVAAAVCDGGIWELKEALFLRQQRCPEPLPRDRLDDLVATGAIGRLDCPTLITLGERGWLDPDDVKDIVARAATAGRDITLRSFPESETAAAQNHADNPNLSNEVIFDWIESRLRSDHVDDPPPVDIVAAELC